MGFAICERRLKRLEAVLDQSPNASLGSGHAATAAVDMNQQEMVAPELNAASASLLFAIKAIECVGQALNAGSVACASSTGSVQVMSVVDEVPAVSADIGESSMSPDKNSVSTCSTLAKTLGARMANGLDPQTVQPIATNVPFRQRSRLARVRHRRVRPRHAGWRLGSDPL